MIDLQSANHRRRNSLMWSSIGVLYVMLGLAVVILFSLEGAERLRVVGSVCAAAGFYFLTLLVISWCRQKRTLGIALPEPTPPSARAKTRLQFRITGIALAILLILIGFLFLPLLGIEWSESLKEPVRSLVIAVMGLSAVVFGSLFGYCCVTGKEWPTPAIRVERTSR
jgi:NADH:ubiquinone oxidoreductase subunit 4 (subunit M)